MLRSLWLSVNRSLCSSFAVLDLPPTIGEVQGKIQSLIAARVISPGKWPGNQVTLNLGDDLTLRPTVSTPKFLE